MGIITSRRTKSAEGITCSYLATTSGVIGVTGADAGGGAAAMARNGRSEAAARRSVRVMSRRYGSCAPAATSLRLTRLNAAMADVVTEGLKHALEAERRIEPRSNVRAAWEEL